MSNSFEETIAGALAPAVRYDKQKSEEEDKHGAKTSFRMWKRTGKVCSKVFESALDTCKRLTTTAGLLELEV
jgi:hypothetical protein